MALKPPSAVFAINQKCLTLTGDVIVVAVGENEKRFTIHGAQLRPNSAFFEAALGRDWKESTEQVVELPEEHEEQFLVYAQWVYRGLHSGDEGGPQHSFQGMVELYTMGSRLQDLDFQDAMLDLVLHKWHSHLCSMNAPFTNPTANAVNTIFQNTTSDDPLRRLIVDLCVRSTKLLPCTSDACNKMAEFYFELAKAAKGGIVGDQKAVIAEGQQICKYHQHGEGPCYRAIRT